MTTIRGLVKKELVKRGYPIEKSHTSKSRIRGMNHFNIEKKGIRLERRCLNKYSDPMMTGWVEELTISTKGFITEEEMKEIVDECKKDYEPYATEVIVYIYTN